MHRAIRAIHYTAWMRLPDDDDALDRGPFDESADDESLDDGSLDDEFPLGDGTADTGAVVVCPYCAQAVQLTLDPGGGASQDYVEDCEVCCQPWRVRVRYDAYGAADVQVIALDA